MTPVVEISLAVDIDMGSKFILTALPEQTTEVIMALNLAEEVIAVITNQIGISICTENVLSIIESVALGAVDSGMLTPVSEMLYVKNITVMAGVVVTT